MAWPVALVGVLTRSPLQVNASSLADMVAAVPRPVVQLVQTVVVLAFGVAASRLLVRLFGRRLSRLFKRPSLTRTALRALRLGVFLLVAAMLLRIYGIELADITLSVAVFSAVVGVVLAPIVGSVISGLFLLADQPYEVGDMIELVDRNQRGFVEDITLRYTKIFTLDNTFLVVPNGTMRDRDVVNYSAEDSRTRRSLPVLVTYESDIEEARTLLERSAREVEEIVGGGPDIRIGAARYPAGPTCYVDEFGDHGILLNLRYWVKEPYKLLTVRSRILERAWPAIEDANVEIAYPHSHLYFDETSGSLPVSVGNGRGIDPKSLSLDEFE